MVLCDSYTEDVVNDETRVYMKFHPRIAPVTVGVFPLVKKDGLAELAKEIELELRESFTTYYDQSGAIGRRYRRQDEIGTPYCITIDYTTKDDETVTLRYRDTTQQIRINRKEILSTIQNELRIYVPR